MHVTISRVRRSLRVLPDRSRRTASITRKVEDIGYFSKRAVHFLVSAIRNVVAVRLRSLSCRLPSIRRWTARPTTTLGEAIIPLTLFQPMTVQFVTTTSHRQYHGMGCQRFFLQVSQIPVCSLHSISHTSRLPSPPLPPIRESSSSSSSTTCRILTLLKDSPDLYPPGSLPAFIIKDAELSIVSLTEVVSTGEGKKKDYKTRQDASKSKSYTTMGEGNYYHQNNDRYDYTRGLEILNQVMFLLSRLVQEQKAQHLSRHNGYYDPHPHDEEEDCDDAPSRPYTVRPFLLNRVVDCWRILLRNRMPRSSKNVLNHTPRFIGRNSSINNFTKEDISMISPADMISWIESLDEESTSSVSSAPCCSSYSGQILSDNRTWTMIIDALCSSGEECAEIAQWLLDQRLDLSREYDDRDGNNDGNDDYHGKSDNDSKAHERLRPDTTFITNVIRAWAKSRRTDIAPEMAEGLLSMMYDLHDLGWKDSSPNAHTYAAVMESWSLSERQDRCDRIVALLEEMKKRNDVEPDRVCYQYALNCWARSTCKSRHNVEKAHGLLQEMISLYCHVGIENVAPNHSNFSTVMMAAARTGDAERVEALYEQMEDLYRTTGQKKFRPTIACKNALLLAKAKSGAVAEAQGLLDELTTIALCSSHNRDLMPARSFFVDVLVAWTKCRDVSTVSAATRAHSVLAKMIELSTNERYYHLRPDARLFDKVILCWSRTRAETAAAQIDTLISEMHRLGFRPTLPTYTNLMLAHLRGSRMGAPSEIQKIFDELSDRCSRGERDICPDKYVYTILIDAWVKLGDTETAEQQLQAMVDHWKAGNERMKPDSAVFMKILKDSSGEKCEQYIGMMKEIGVAVPVEAYTCLLDAMSSVDSVHSLERRSILRNAIDDVLDGVGGGRIRRPSFKQYKRFLNAIVNCDIQDRSKQAQHQLKEMQLNKQVPLDLLPRTIHSKKL